MKSSPPGLIVATLLTHASARARIRDAVEPNIPVQHCSSPREAIELVLACDVAVMLIDAVDAKGASNAPVVEALRQNAPRLAILIYCSLVPGASPAVLACAKLGAAGLLFEGVDDSAFAIRTALRAASYSAVPRALYDELVGFLPPELTPLLRYAIARLGEEPSVSDAAACLGVDRKTLANWLRRYSTLGPREFINWIRLAIAVGILETTERTAEKVALDFGFPSGTAFRNMLTRYTGETSTGFRAEDSFRRLIRLFKTHFDSKTIIPSAHPRKDVTDRATHDLRVPRARRA